MANSELPYQRLTPHGVLRMPPVARPETTNIGTPSAGQYMVEPSTDYRWPHVLTASFWTTTAPTGGDVMTRRYDAPQTGVCSRTALDATTNDDPVWVGPVYPTVQTAILPGDPYAGYGTDGLPIRGGSAVATPTIDITSARETHYSTVQLISGYIVRIALKWGDADTTDGAAHNYVANPNSHLFAVKMNAPYMPDNPVFSDIEDCAGSGISGSAGDLGARTYDTASDLTKGYEAWRLGSFLAAFRDHTDPSFMRLAWHQSDVRYIRCSDFFPALSVDLWSGWLYDVTGWSLIYGWPAASATTDFGGTVFVQWNSSFCYHRPPTVAVVHNGNLVVGVRRRDGQPFDNSEITTHYVDDIALYAFESHNCGDSVRRGLMATGAETRIATLSTGGGGAPLSGWNVAGATYHKADGTAGTPWVDDIYEIRVPTTATPHNGLISVRARYVGEESLPDRAYYEHGSGWYYLCDIVLRMDTKPPPWTMPIDGGGVVIGRYPTLGIT